MTRPNPNGLAETRSAQHRSVKRLRRLVRQSKARSQERAFVVEGVKLVVEALRSDLEVEEVFVTPDASADSVVTEAARTGATVHLISPETLASVADVVNPQPVTAVVGSPSWSLSDLGDTGTVMVGVELQDPGNVGTLLRSAEASGCSGVVVCPPSVDCLNPKAVRASAGSILRLPVVIVPLDEAVAEFRRQGRLVVATAADAGQSYDQVNLANAAIVVGNEPRGLSDDAMNIADEVVSIPMDGAVESLNVAAAAAVLGFESQRQRRNQADVGQALDGRR